MSDSIKEYTFLVNERCGEINIRAEECGFGNKELGLEHNSITAWCNEKDNTITINPSPYIKIDFPFNDQGLERLGSYLHDIDNEIEAFEEQMRTKLLRKLITSSLKSHQEPSLQPRSL